MSPDDQGDLDVGEQGTSDVGVFRTSNFGLDKAASSRRLWSAGSITGTAAGPHRPRPTSATGLTDLTGEGFPSRPRRLFPLAGPMFGPTVFGYVLLGISVLARRGAVRPTANRPRSLEASRSTQDG